MSQGNHSIPLKLKLRAAVGIDYPEASEILVSFPDDWEVVGQIQREDRTLYIAGMPVSEERPERDHFYGLPPALNLALNKYRLYKLFLPWPQPSILVGWNEETGTGRVLKMGDVKVQLQPIGQAQAWFSPEAAVIWECYTHEQQRPDNWQEELATFWQIVEGDIGTTKIYIEPHEPAFEEGYTTFLSRLGYAPDPDYPCWWSKRRSEGA
jgi:hypothetical protein